MAFSMLVLFLAGLGDPVRFQLTLLVSPILKGHDDVGVVVGVIRNGETYIYGFGKVLLDGKMQKPDGDTLFEIGSISKTFAGILLADLVNKEVVKLDDPVQKYLPKEWKVPRRDDRDITLLHLATHSSSLPVQPPGLGLIALAQPKEDQDNAYKHYTAEMLSAQLRDMHLARPIGSRFEYSNLGVGLLGHALAQAANEESYESLLQSRLLKPVGMRETRIKMDEAALKRMAPGHRSNGKAISNWDFGCLEACGGIRSNVKDLFTYARLNMGLIDSPLKSAVQMSHQPWRDVTDTFRDVGLCWMLERPGRGNPSLIWHNGGTGGYRSFLGIMPEKSVAVVVLTNISISVDAIGLQTLKVLVR